MIVVQVCVNVEIKEEPRKLLSHVKGLEITEMNDVETCCGFGGTFAVKFEAISIAMGEQKVENALATGAEYIISTDHSCLMHLQGYIDHKGYNVEDNASGRCVGIRILGSRKSESGVESGSQLVLNTQIDY